MEMKYVLGVDGGNTKTDYFLFDQKGNFVSHIRAGTCSHEQLKDSYEGSYRLMKESIDKLLEESQVQLSDIVVGVFGLAGVDTPHQKESLEKVIERFGIEKVVVDNDGYLGLKAGSVQGYGICAINGTGTVTVGIDQKGNRLQVGGIGHITTDDAGGAFMTRQIFREVYNSLFRMGTMTPFTEAVQKMLGIQDKKYYIERISQLYGEKFSHTPYIKILFDYADKGDEVALKVINHVAYELAKSSCGCIQNLQFDQAYEIPMILAGSIWVKPTSQVLINAYKDYISELINCKNTYIVLQVPPGIGAVLWALEILMETGLEVHLREDIIQKMEKIYSDSQS